MKARPILFSGPMVQALLADRKTQTRRIVKPQPQPNGGKGLSPVEPYHTPQGKWTWVLAATGHGDGTSGSYCPYGQPGDLLWVRETFSIVRESTSYETGGDYCAFEWEREFGDPQPYLGGNLRGGIKSAVYYPADGEDACPSEMFPCIGLKGNVLREKEIRWQASIHMPRWASRLTLELTEVRVERLQDISEEDAIAEGCFFTDYGRRCYHHGNNGYENTALCPAPDEYHPRNPGWMWKESTSHQHCMNTARGAFGNLWNTINGPDSWTANPWVWALSFRVHRCNVDALLKERAA